MNITTKPKFTKKLMIDIIYDIVGSFFLAMGIHCFVEPANIAPGGVSGIAIMINFVTNLPIGILTFVINIPILILSYRYLGKSFTLKSTRTLIISTLILDFFVTPLFPIYEGDRLLGSVFGGILMGIGLAMVFLRGSTTAGGDILSYLLKLKFPFLPIGRALLVIDCIILVASMAVFRNIESGLFGLVSIYVCTKIIDSIIYGFERGSQVTIISKQVQAIKNRIMSEMDRGVTLLKGTGGYSNQDLEVMICVVRKYQFSQIKEIIKEIDPDAFVFMTETEEILGEGFKSIHN